MLKQGNVRVLGLKLEENYMNIYYCFLELLEYHPQYNPDDKNRTRYI